MYYTYLGYLRKFGACLVPCIPIWYSMIFRFHGHQMERGIRQDSPPPADIQDRVIQRDDDTPETSPGRGHGGVPKGSRDVWLGKWWEIHRNAWKLMEVHGDFVDDRIWGPSLRQPHVFDPCSVVSLFQSRIRRRLVTYHQAGGEVAVWIWPIVFNIRLLSNPKENPEIRCFWRCEKSRMFFQMCLMPSKLLQSNARSAMQSWTSVEIGSPVVHQGSVSSKIWRENHSRTIGKP